MQSQLRTLEEACHSLRGPAKHARRVPFPVGVLGRREWDGLRDALAWLKLTSTAISSDDCSPTIDSVNSEARKHLVAVEIVENAYAASTEPASPEVRSHIGLFHAFVKYWRDAAASAAALGLGGDISCRYYGEHIELPEKVIVARKWFETAEKLEHQNAMDPKRLAKLINDGNSHITIVIECRSSWPHARCLSVSRRIDKWNLLVAYWVHKVKKEALSNSYEKGSNAAVIDFRTREVFTACNRLKEAHDIIVYGKKIRREFRANMLRKRTCSMCGKTAPNSSPSFAYCGGCHGFRLRECIPRFCSEACQHAHWHAGHKDECPCARDE